MSKIIETHFVLEVRDFAGQHAENLRKVYKLDRIAPTYIIEKTYGKGAVELKQLSEEEFRKMANALALKLYAQESPEEQI
jgi:K+/H+ antiporter YhaU regulatory subunit KhtT